MNTQRKVIPVFQQSGEKAPALSFECDLCHCPAEYKCDECAALPDTRIFIGSGEDVSPQRHNMLNI